MTSTAAKLGASLDVLGSVLDVNGNRIANEGFSDTFVVMAYVILLRASLMRMH